jgi:hypothetical protein
MISHEIPSIKLRDSIGFIYTSFCILLDLVKKGGIASWLFSSRKEPKEPKEPKESKELKESSKETKEFNAKAKLTLRDRTISAAVTLERPAINRSVSVSALMKPNSLPTGPPDPSWGPEEIRNYKMELINKYDQEKSSDRALMPPPASPSKKSKCNSFPIYSLTSL